MSKYLKVFGVTCGILAFFFCLCSGAKMATIKELDISVYNSFGFFIIGMAFFTGPLLIILSLKSGHTVSKQGQKPVVKKLKPVKKAKPAPGKPAAAKPPEKTDPKGEVTVIYVGNLSPEANETVLKTAFSGFGEIHKIKIIKDRGRPKGFGFVEMYGKDQALKAIEAMNGEELAGRPLKVNEAKAKPKARRPKNQKPQDSIEDEPIRPNIFE